MKDGTSTRMAEVFQRVSAIADARCELLPGRFADSDMQLAIELPGGVQLSVLPDADVPALLFEAVRLDGDDRQLKDKLPLDAVVDLVRSHVRGQGAGAAS